MRIWDFRYGLEVQSPLTGHTEHIYAVAFLPDGSQVISGSADKTLRIWDIHTHKSAVIRCGSSVWAVAFSPDGSLVAAGLKDKTVHIGNTLTQLDDFQLLSEHSNTILSVAFSPDGETLASASDDHPALEY